MNEIKVKVNFEKRIIQKQGISLTSGDYNSTKIKFEFDKEYTERKVFELANEEGTAVFVSDIPSSNELVLVGYVDVKDDNDYIKYTDTSDNIYWYDTENEQLYDSEYNESEVDIDTLTKIQTEASIFASEGNYQFEISLYGTSSKLTSATGFLSIQQENVRVEDEVVLQYIPVFDNLINEAQTLITALNGKIGEVETLNITATKVDNTTTVTITKKDGTTESVVILDGLTTSVNNIEQIDGNVDIDLDNIPDGTHRKIPTATSDLTNDSGFITNSVNNLLNYYLKSETYTKQEVNILIGQIQTLITTALRNYYTKTEIDTQMEGKANSSDIPTKTSDLTNDSGFITNSVNNLTNYTNNAGLPTAVRNVRPLNANTATTIAVNTIYDLGEQTSLTLNLPTGQLGDFIQVDFLSTSTPTTLTITATSSALSDLDLTPEANKIYSLFFVYGRLETAVYGWKIAFSENTRTVI